MSDSVVDSLATCHDKDEGKRLLLLFGKVIGLVMNTHPVESAFLKLFLFHAEVWLFLSVLGIETLEDAKDHEHVGVVGSLLMKEGTRYSPGFNLT